MQLEHRLEAEDGGTVETLSPFVVMANFHEARGLEDFIASSFRKAHYNKLHGIDLVGQADMFYPPSRQIADEDSLRFRLFRWQLDVRRIGLKPDLWR